MSGRLSLRNAKMWLLPFLAVVSILGTSASKGREREENPQNKYSLILTPQLLRTPGGIQGPSEVCTGKGCVDQESSVGATSLQKRHRYPVHHLLLLGSFWQPAGSSPVGRCSSALHFLAIPWFISNLRTTVLCDALPGPSPWAEGTNRDSHAPDVVNSEDTIAKNLSRWFLKLWNVSNPNTSWFWPIIRYRKHFLFPSNKWWFKLSRTRERERRCLCISK